MITYLHLQAAVTQKHAVINVETIYANRKKDEVETKSENHFERHSNGKWLPVDQNLSFAPIPPHHVHLCVYDGGKVIN